MTAELAHRGPDATAEFVAPYVAFGMTRLAIIDPAGGRQPFFDCSRSSTLVLNGEIYNHVELRRMLERNGHMFRSRCDAEVAVHLYEEYGVDCVSRLRGMFAFALWDSRQRLLVLARDRFGEKPLHYWLGDRRIVFASELRALVGCRAFRAELEPTAVHEYLHYQYVPEPLTPLAGVVKLPAAHVLTVDVPRWRVHLHRYWSLAGAPALDCAPGEPGEAVAAQLGELAPLVVRADAPIGVALSGGVDSGAVAALAAGSSTVPVHAFSVGYRGRPDGDEREQAGPLAAQLGMPFHEVEIGEPDVVAGFAALVRAWNEPIADLAGFSYLAIAEAANRHGVRVLLQGQGGDELFWGYPWVRRALDRSRATGSGRLTFYDLDPDFREAHEQAGQLYPDDWLRRVDVDAPVDRFARPEYPGDLGVEFTRLICQTYLLSNGIAQGDRLTMARSVELRLPLVDHRLVETVIGLRKRVPDDRLEPKAWLRQAVARLVPPAVARRPKRPFSPPLTCWHGALLRAHGWMLPDGVLVERGVLRPDAAKRLSVADFPPGAGSPLSFKALVLEAWCRATLGGGALGR